MFSRRFQFTDIFVFHVKFHTEQKYITEVVTPIFKGPQTNFKFPKQSKQDGLNSKIFKMTIDVQSMLTPSVEDSPPEYIRFFYFSIFLYYMLSSWYEQFHAIKKCFQKFVGRLSIEVRKNEGSASWYCARPLDLVHGKLIQVEYLVFFQVCHFETYSLIKFLFSKTLKIRFDCQAPGFQSMALPPSCVRIHAQRQDQIAIPVVPSVGDEVLFLMFFISTF